MTERLHGVASLLGTPIQHIINWELRVNEKIKSYKNRVDGLLGTKYVYPINEQLTLFQVVTNID